MTSTTFFIIFIPILAILLLAINLILAPHNPYQEKDSVFECGFHSFLGQNRTQFSVSFFIFALLFLLFDLEILLVYPYSVSGYTNDIYGLVIMMVFFVLLTLGFIFELGKNALTIDSRQTSNYNSVDTTDYHAFLRLSTVMQFFVLFISVTVVTIIIAIYSAPILDGLAYGVSLLLYSSDILVAASSVPLSDADKSLLKEADDYYDNAAKETSSLTEVQRASNNNKESIEANINSEKASVEATYTNLNQKLEAAKSSNPSHADDFEERIHLIKDAKQEAINALNETKQTALELIDDQNSTVILLMVGEGIVAESLIGPCFIFVSTVLKLYSNKAFRYAFKVWLSTFK